MKLQDELVYLYNRWCYRLTYIDSDGCEVNYTKEGFNSKEEAKNHARVKRQKIENEAAKRNETD